jgi:membrane associated rhomboid family serine protease
MGIYDREYYRDKTRGSGWLTGISPACNVLIAINVAAFVGQKMLPPGMLEQAFRANGEQIFHQLQVWRLLTATFLHADVWHILMNMLFLWMVGREMEPFYGTRDFTAMYLAAAVFSTLCWAVVDTFDSNAGNGNMIGASGAVMAVVVLYTLYYPRREVLVMFVIPVQMWVLLSVYLGYNFLQFLNPNPIPGDRVAYSAHLGGAAFGYLFKVGDLRLSRLESLFRRKPRLRIVPAEPRESSTATRPSIGPTWSSGLAASARPTPVAVIPEEMFDEKLDEILVKIAREGRGSLSEDENRVLEEASRRARNRRSERI